MGKRYVRRVRPGIWEAVCGHCPWRIWSTAWVITFGYAGRHKCQVPRG